MKKIMLATGLTAMLALAACNTVNGAGRDLKSAGDAVTDASGNDVVLNGLQPDGTIMDVQDGPTEDAEDVAEGGAADVAEDGPSDDVEDDTTER